MVAKAPISAIQSIQKVMEGVSSVAKRERNEVQKFNFRGIDAVVNAVAPVLREVGGVIVPTVLEAQYDRGITKNGTPTVEAFLLVEFAWYGTDGGEPVKGVVRSEAMDTSDKATAKAMSVALRTYLLQTLMLPTDEKDPDAEYHERATVKKEIPMDYLDRLHAAANLKALETIWNEAVSGGFGDTVKAVVFEKKATLS